jgi:hypothetical protein
MSMRGENCTEASVNVISNIAKTIDTTVMIEPAIPARMTCATCGSAREGNRTCGTQALSSGQYPTPLGYETIDPSTNLFYSHSYIFNFGLPFKHTGALTVTHLNDVVDVYAGVDTGTNTTFGRLGDNNGRSAGSAASTSLCSAAT